MRHLEPPIATDDYEDVHGKIFANMAGHTGEALKRIDEAKKKRLRELDLIGLGLTKLPDQLFDLTELRELDLSGNPLAALPAEIGQLQALETLYLTDSQLAALPVEIGQLRALQKLSFHGNQLAALPVEIGQLQALQALSLSSNQLAALPVEIGQLQALQTLNLSRNQLVALPVEIGQLEALQGLYLRSNQLAALPISMRNLGRLRVLILHGNPKLGLPAEVLGKNTWRPSEAADPRSILEYYFRTLVGARPLNEAKLILVGRGAVGKTTLVRRLMTGKFSKPRKTEGIHIKEWPLSLRRNDKVQLNVWDFGGQEIMHSTHQFFMTERSLYLLVVTGREGREDEDAEYWLKLIHGIGGDSAVIVVLNKQEEHPFELNRGALVQKYPNIKGFIQTDCESGLGIEELRIKIKGETDLLEGLRKEFPAQWFQIKKRLSGMKENFLTFQDYRKVCSEFEETDAQAQEDLAGYLHVLGVALNYCDDPRLSHMHVLNPQWVVDGIYRIINAKTLAQRHGELHQSDLGKILPKDDYPRDMYGYLLGLMRKFELCFPLPEDGSYLVPDLLAKEQSPVAAEFDPEDCLNFQYDYGSTPIPEGLLPRFIVRSHTLSRGRPRWRTGVILDFEGASALVRADKAEKKVYLSIQGGDAARQRLLAIIRSDFDRIHSDLKGLQPEQLVPVPGHPEVAVEYADLLAAEEGEIKEIPKRIEGKMVKLAVRDLLAKVDSDAPKADAIPVFVSYAHKDEAFREALSEHLSLLEKLGFIKVWHDRRIAAGESWPAEIDRNLENARIILMLISSTFTKSEFCWTKERGKALELRRQGKAEIVPIVVRAVNWDSSDLAGIQALPKDTKPVKRPGNDEAWMEVSQKVEALAKRLQASEGNSKRFLATAP